MARLFSSLGKLLKSVQDSSTATNLALTGFTANADSTVQATLTANAFTLRELQTAPSSATDTGTAGEIRITADAIYVCTAANTWKTVAIATWG